MGSCMAAKRTRLIFTVMALMGEERDSTKFMLLKYLHT